MSSKKDITLIFSSNPVNGALNLTPNGDRYNTVLYNPISVPRSAKYCIMQVIQSNIWWVVPNLSPVLNNDVFVFFDGVSTQTITIPLGLYDLGGIYSALQVASDNIPAAHKFFDMFIFAGNQATQKVEITLLLPGLSINWALSTVRVLMGFDASQVFTSTFSGQTIVGNNPAAFNSITSFFIHNNLVGDGIPTNAIASGVVANVFVDVPPGSLINYAPYLPPIVHAPELIGAKITNIVHYLTDQNNNAVNTNGEFWSYTLQISYWD